MKLEMLRDEQIASALAPKEKAVTMTEPEREAALEMLRDPRLVERIVEDFARCGVVGEETNKLVGYLGAVSRHLEKPLAVIVQSSSASGKSSLMDAVLAFVPEEHRVQYSSMTGQSLFYMGDTDLQNKVLAIAEEAGAQRASYPLKLLQSEGEVSIASTGKDPVSGRHVTHEYRVKGPVMLFLTTTSPDVDEELLNRCLVLSVNEEREQTQAIHRVQRATSAATADRRQRPGRGAELPGLDDPDAARPDEVPDAHPGHRVPASVAARGEDDHRRRGQTVPVHRSHRSGRGAGKEAHP
jgi:hypothetical protein